MNVVFVSNEIPAVTITNVCSSFYTGVSFNLERIALELKSLGAYYNPARIATLMVTMDTGYLRGAKALVYRNGIVILSKAPCESLSQVVAWEVALLFNKFNIPASMKNFSITNIASKFELGFPVHIRDVFEHFRIYSSYDSKKFPALTIKPRIEGTKNPTVNLFASGNGVITGTSSREQIIATMKWLYPIAHRFKYKYEFDINLTLERNYALQESGQIKANTKFNGKKHGEIQVDHEMLEQELDSLIEEYTKDVIEHTENTVILSDVLFGC